MFQVEVFFVVGADPILWVFSNIACLYPLDAYSNPALQYDIQEYLQVSPELPMAENQCSRGHMFPELGSQKERLYLPGSPENLSHKLASTLSLCLMAHFQKHQGGDSLYKHQRWMLFFIGL